MLFSSLEFLVLFLPLTLAVALRLRAQPLLRWIAFISVGFYAFAGHWSFIVPMLVTTTVDYWVAILIEREPRPSRRWWLLAVSLLGNLGMLAYFKYSGLFVRTAEQVLVALGREGSEGAFSWAEVILPAGISFYTFQTLAYIIDVWRGQAPAERNFVRFAGFVSFFPHLVAGPLTRHHQLIPQLARVAATGIDPRWRAGVLLFCVGLAKKVLIADRLGNLIDPMLTDAGALDVVHAWLALLGYSFQIYFDFSGYSDMAIGLGRLFAIELPQNFDSPYKAVSPTDFWRRWHMTLSLWLRDYLYISLGGNRCSPARRRFNVMTTMVLGGLWHGANWTFAAWGAWHGALLVMHQATPAWERMSLFWQRNVTFLLVTLGWVFFRAPDFAHAAAWFAGLAGLHGAGTAWTSETGKLLTLVVLCLVIVRAFRNSLELPLERLGPLPQVGLAGHRGRRAAHELQLQVSLLPILMRPFVVAVALLLGLVVSVNGLATWDRARHEARIERLAAGFRPGQALLGYRDTDERRFQKARLAVIPPPRVVAFGSSSVVGLSTAMVVGSAPGEFYNAGLSGGTVEDFIVLWTVLRDAGKIPEAAIFAISNWEFNASHPQVRWLAWADDVARLVGAMEGAAWWNSADALRYRWYRLKDLVSYSVLRTSLHDLGRLLAGREPRGADLLRTLADQLIDEWNIDGRRAMRADGSLVYEADFETRGPAEVRADALDLALRVHAGLGAFAWDAERPRRLGLLWRDMHAHGVRIVAYLPPYHPVVWEMVRRDAGAMAGLARTRAALDELGARSGARVHDFSDPASVPCVEAEFLDGNHVRAACLSRIVARVSVAAPVVDK